MYKILLTASIKSVWAGSGPYCSDAVRAPFTFHTQICIRRHQHTKKPHTTTTHIYIFLIYSRLLLCWCTRTYIHPSTRIASTTFIYIKRRQRSIDKLKINKSACGVLAQINTLFSLSVRTESLYNKYQSNLWYPKANWALERLLCLLRCVCVLTNGFESDIILHY
jgi:hypothetical protein